MWTGGRGTYRPLITLESRTSLLASQTGLNNIVVTQLAWIKTYQVHGCTMLHLSLSLFSIMPSGLQLLNTLPLYLPLKCTKKR